MSEVCGSFLIRLNLSLVLRYLHSTKMQKIDRLTEDEYENQFYEFSTTELTEKFKEGVKQIIQEVMCDLEKEIGKTANWSDDKAILQERINELYNLYMASANPAITKFEEESRKMFAIPVHVLLDEDKLKTEKVTKEHLEDLKKDISSLEQTLIREKVFLAKCKQMKETFETIIDPIYNKIEKVLPMIKTNAENMEKQMKLLMLCNSKLQQYKSGEKENFKVCNNTENLASVNNFFES